MNNFEVIACDTDSIFFKKPTGESFSQKEIETLQESLNSLYPSLIRWELNDYFPCIVSAAAKNYLIKLFVCPKCKKDLKLSHCNHEDKKMIFKGSALKDPKKSKALQEFIQTFIIKLSEDKENELVDLYHRYIKEICSITDIKRWTKKITVTEKVLNPERTNEQKVYDAVKNIDGLQEGDKVQVFFKADRSLCLEQDFNGDYDKEGLLESLYKSALIFDALYPVKERLINYKLKKNKLALEALLTPSKIDLNGPRLNFSSLMLQRLQITHPDLYKLIITQNSAPDKVFRAFDYFKPSETKVIIIQQNQYPGIEYELWAKQGVLLLNSHKEKEWKQFLTSILQKIINYGTPLVIIAEEKLQDLKFHDKVLLIDGRDFFKANEFLKQNDREEINWKL